MELVFLLTVVIYLLERMTLILSPDLHDLFQLVGDKYDGLAVLFSSPQGSQQFVGLLRRQDRRGFVQYQNISAAIEGLNNLNPLHLSYGNVGDFFVQLNRHLVIVNIVLDLRPGRVK